MTWAVALAVWCCLTAGAYLLMSRDLLRIAVGMAVLGGGANLLLFAAGRLGATAPPVVPAGDQVLAAAAANPLPQALVLTAIVIGFALSCFSFVLLLRIQAATGCDDAAALRLAEPPSDDPVKPALPGLVIPGTNVERAP